MSKKQSTLFADGFLESFAGKIIESRQIAIIELVANTWDAGATEVDIKWPVEDGDEFYILDNGHGMTESEFNFRFRTLGYNRTQHQSNFAEIPTENKDKIAIRPAFGRNGKGRLGGFSFGETFTVSTWKNRKQNTFDVSKDNTNNLASFQQTETEISKEGHGTKISVNKSYYTELSAEDARKEIGMRFLTDPNFRVSLNGELITFLDIPEDCIETKELVIPKVGKVIIKIIDVLQTDKTTHQHGIAWHVKNRLVGECTWKGSGSEHLLDGRRMAAKRYIFIIDANCLEEAVAPDWTMFLPSSNKWNITSEQVYKYIKEYLLELTKEQREEIFANVENSNRNTLKTIGIVKREKWESFIKTVQIDCPSISSEDLNKLGALLAHLEQTESKYGLIHILSNASYEELDNLSEILSKWNIDFAKIVLDEVEYRTKLLEKLQSKVLSKRTDEVQDLQPLFHRGLWIFGPEYESIEYTSNQGMTKVIQDLFGVEQKGSRKRPDFAILKDSTVGLYGLPKFGTDGGEIGIDRLTIVELKKPGVKVGQEEVDQPWKYVKELFEKGLLKEYSQVTCFVLGSELDPLEGERTTKKGGKVIIQPLDYDTIVRRAKSRLLNLHDKIKNAPFLMNERVKEYMREKSELELFD